VGDLLDGPGIHGDPVQGRTRLQHLVHVVERQAGLGVVSEDANKVTDQV
jgi:hypothetical protein